MNESQMTSAPGVFARSPDRVVRAVRDNRKAAACIHKCLSKRVGKAAALDLSAQEPISILIPHSDERFSSRRRDR